MIELVITTRSALGELWLPWCVERARPDRVIRIDQEPDCVEEARQLRVRNTEEAGSRTALRDNDGVDSTTAIEDKAARFRRVAECGLLVRAAAPPLRPDEWPQAFPLDEGPMLHEACHRACALYASGVERFELSALVHPIIAVPGNWHLYEHPSLRIE
jgi:hypothetical protein